MAGITLNEVRGLGDPHRQYNYDLLIPTMPGGGNGTSLRVSVTNTSIPGFGSEPFESNHGGHTVKHAGRGIFPRTLTVEYEEMSDLRVLTAFKAWRDLQWNQETGAQSPPNTYKTDAFLQLLDSNKQVRKTCRLRGVFVEDVADTGLDGATSDSTKISVTLSYDDFILE